MFCLLWEVFVAVHNYVTNVSLIKNIKKEVRKWLRQQSKDCVVLVERWNKYQCWWRMCQEVLISHFYILYPFVTHLLTLLHNSSSENDAEIHS